MKNLYCHNNNLIDNFDKRVKDHRPYWPNCPDGSPIHECNACVWLWADGDAALNDSENATSVEEDQQNLEPHVPPIRVSQQMMFTNSLSCGIINHS